VCAFECSGIHRIDVAVPGPLSGGELCTRKRLDYAEYGGAPLLGLNGVCIKAHGKSSALAIKNAVRVATQAVENDVVGHIARGLAASEAVEATS